jgi:hypothetical protein
LRSIYRTIYKQTRVCKITTVFLFQLLQFYNEVWEIIFYFTKIWELRFHFTEPATGQWFSLGTPVSSTNKTDCHDINEILSNTIPPSSKNTYIYLCDLPILNTFSQFVEMHCTRTHRAYKFFLYIDQHPGNNCVLFIELFTNRHMSAKYLQYFYSNCYNHKL